MRKCYIDNLRTMCILLLFPFHTSMIYNNWGEKFYISSSAEYLPSLFNVIVYPWWMNLLFVLAGISSYYALTKKSSKEYLSERIHKLLIPLLVGLVVIIPAQTYIADVFYNGYSGNYFEHYKIFFTKFTDLVGVDGGFTPGHLWFILYLFIISLITIPFMTKYIKSKRKLPYEKINIVILMLLFIIVLVCTPILQIGKSVGEALACFALGFFILSNEKIQDRLEKNKWVLGGLFLFFMVILVILWNLGLDKGLLFDIEYRAYLWSGILFFLGFGQAYLNRKNKVLTYLSKASFSLYYFHQTILIIIGYYVLKLTNVTLIQFVLIMVGSFIFSLGCYELFRRNKVTAYLFGIKCN
ncbi:MAG: acyltransferase family protein [Clostridiales bacterium]|nr:acyltransferase family protein [Clostridiales bacterium]